MSFLEQISPIDGRYGEKTRILSIFFSEAGLIKYRIKIEIYYFLELCKIIPHLKKINKSDLKKVESIYLKLNSSDIKKVKKIELLAKKWKNISMLARTHGQAASPTKLGKEMKVFSERLKTQFKYLKKYLTLENLGELLET